MISDVLGVQVMAHHAVACHAVVITKAGAIKKTTSGKVQRRACRAAFMEGQYAQVHPALHLLQLAAVHYSSGIVE